MFWGQLRMFYFLRDRFLVKLITGVEQGLVSSFWLLLYRFPSLGLAPCFSRHRLVSFAMKCLSLDDGYLRFLLPLPSEGRLELAVLLLKHGSESLPGGLCQENLAPHIPHMA